VAFYKAFGFSRLFPHSREFARYHLGNLPENETHEVEVLAGAFMLLRKSVLDKTSLLDEDFFMYGEDIDLSYRIIQAGYKNYYFAGTRIIHYKGESTRKSSVNYVTVFYNAMIIFARKHLAGGKAGSFILLLRFAIYFRAAISLFVRLLKVISFPVMDAAIIFGGMYLLKNFWQNNIKADIGLQYPAMFMYAAVPAYIVLWLGSVYLSGGYDRSSTIAKVVRGIFFGTIVIAALYGFLDEQYRSSRALIVLGAAWSAMSMIIFRLLYNLFANGSFSWGEREIKNVLIAGSEKESKRVLQLLQSSGVRAELLGLVAPDGTPVQESFLGSVSELPDLVSVYQADEVIFCSSDIPARRVFGLMSLLGPRLEYKLVPRGSNSIIGSNSKDSQGELYSSEIAYNIGSASSQRNKRLFDLSLSLLLLVLSPLLFLWMQDKGGFFQNLVQVLLGRRSWVGYAVPADAALPALKPGILSPATGSAAALNHPATVVRLNQLYAKNYAVWKDLRILRLGLRKLGGRG